MSLKEKLSSAMASHPRLVTIGISFTISALATALITVGVMDQSVAAIMVSEDDVVIAGPSN